MMNKVTLSLETYQQMIDEKHQLEAQIIDCKREMAELKQIYFETKQTLLKALRFIMDDNFDSFMLRRYEYDDIASISHPVKFPFGGSIEMYKELGFTEEQLLEYTLERQEEYRKENEVKVDD